MKRSCAFLFLAAAVLSAYACGPSNTVTVTFPNGRSVSCLIADTPRTRAEGLTILDSLAPDQGMIFVYASETASSFWMPKDLDFQLDLIFLDADKTVVHIHERLPICESNVQSQCPSYGSGGKRHLYAVEVVAGFCEEVGLELGDKLLFTLP